jgi:hypothetical protein
VINIINVVLLNRYSISSEELLYYSFITLLIHLVISVAKNQALAVFGKHIHVGKKITLATSIYERQQLYL